MADSAMRRMFTAGMASMPAEHRAMMADMLRADSLAARRSGARRVPAKKPAAKSGKAPKPATKPAPATRKDPMAGMDHGKMSMPPGKPPV
jgi:hypothetical protein